MSDSNSPSIGKDASERRVVMHILYGLHTLAWLSAGTFAVVALIVNYIQRGEENDPVIIGHHNYMIRTFWWTLLWLVLCSWLWLLFVLPGVVAYAIIGLWYLYRCIRGWVRMNDGKAI